MSLARCSVSLLPAAYRGAVSSSPAVVAAGAIGAMGLHILFCSSGGAPTTLALSALAIPLVGDIGSFVVADPFAGPAFALDLALAFAVGLKSITLVGPGWLPIVSVILPSPGMFSAGLGVMGRGVVNPRGQRWGTRLRCRRLGGHGQRRQPQPFSETLEVLPRLHNLWASGRNRPTWRHVVSLRESQAHTPPHSKKMNGREQRLRLLPLP